MELTFNEKQLLLLLVKQGIKETTTNEEFKTLMKGEFKTLIKLYQKLEVTEVIKK